MSSFMLTLCYLVVLFGLASLPETTSQEFFMRSFFQMPARPTVPLHVQREGRSQVCYMRLPGRLTLSQVSDVVRTCHDCSAIIPARTFDALQMQMEVDGKGVPRTVVRVSVSPGKLPDLLALMTGALSKCTPVSPVVVMHT